MDYRIFNVRTLLCVCVYTGVGHTDNESAQHFNSEKLLQKNVYAPDGIRTSGHGVQLDLEVDAPPQLLLF